MDYVSKKDSDEFFHKPLHASIVLFDLAFNDLIRNVKSILFWSCIPLGQMFMSVDFWALVTTLYENAHLCDISLNISIFSSLPCLSRGLLYGS